MRLHSRRAGAPRTADTPAVGGRSPNNVPTTAKPRAGIAIVRSGAFGRTRKRVVRTRRFPLRSECGRNCPGKNPLSGHRRRWARSVARSTPNGARRTVPTTLGTVAGDASRGRATPLCRSSRAARGALHAPAAPDNIRPVSGGERLLAVLPNIRRNGARLPTATARRWKAHWGRRRWPVGERRFAPAGQNPACRARGNDQRLLAHSKPLHGRASSRWTGSSVGRAQD